MRKLPLLSGVLLASLSIRAQTPVAFSTDPHGEVAAETQRTIVRALDSIFAQINGSGTSPTDPSGTTALSLSVLNSLKGIEANEQDNDAHYYKPRLINLYPIAGDTYLISLSFAGNAAATNPLRAIVSLVCAVRDEQVTFNIPVYYLTRNWKTAKVGNIRYHYPDKVNRKRAKQFNRSNTRIAGKLGVEPEQFDFYLCDNYQQILHLLGYEYDSTAAGKTTDGYGVDGGTIFSIMHNEDFSHDVFHYYAAKIRTHARNSAAEEGIAYSWGNAYYTDEHGEMIGQQQLVKALKAYLRQHPQASLFDLFNKNPSIFVNQTKVRSLLSSLICDEVERRKGIAGIKALIDCGKGDEQYFRVVSESTGITPENFDREVMSLLDRR